MEKIDRFNCGNGEGMFDNKQGDWVYYEDHKKIVEELEAIKYAHSSTLLNEKYEETFEGWLFDNTENIIIKYAKETDYDEEEHTTVSLYSKYKNEVNL